MFTALHDWQVIGQALEYQQEGPNIDIFSQKGGEGNVVGSPPFSLNDEVTLYARVTFIAFRSRTSLLLFKPLTPMGEHMFYMGRLMGLESLQRRSVCLPLGLRRILVSGKFLQQ